jgi:hypothetical protein
VSYIILLSLSVYQLFVYSYRMLVCHISESRQQLVNLNFVFCNTVLLQGQYRDHEAYGKVIVKRTQADDWHKCFFNDYVNVNDDPCCGQTSTWPSHYNIECMCNVVCSNWGKSIQKISPEVGIPVRSIHSILHKDLNMHCFCQHLAPKMLSPKHKEA